MKQNHKRLKHFDWHSESRAGFEPGQTKRYGFWSHTLTIIPRIFPPKLEINMVYYCTVKQLSIFIISRGFTGNGGRKVRTSSMIMKNGDIHLNKTKA